MKFIFEQYIANTRCSYTSLRPILNTRVQLFIFQYKTRIMHHMIIHLTLVPTIIHLMRTFDHFNILKYDNSFHTRTNPYCQNRIYH